MQCRGPRLQDGPAMKGSFLSGPMTFVIKESVCDGKPTGRKVPYWRLKGTASSGGDDS